MKRRYAIAIESGERNFSGYVPDVDGCVATGQTIDETVVRLKAALTAHLAWMLREGDPIPDPTTTVEYVEVEIQAPVVAR